MARPWFPDKAARIMVACSDGRVRATAAVDILMGLGYTNVVRLEGGFNLWSKEWDQLMRRYGLTQSSTSSIVAFLSSRFLTRPSARTLAHESSHRGQGEILVPPNTRGSVSLRIHSGRGAGGRKLGCLVPRYMRRSFSL
jgi:hypothetical protein